MIRLDGDVMESWKLAILYIFVLWATLTDLKSREIGNRLNGVLLMVGILLHLVEHRWLEPFLLLGLSTLLSLLLYRLGMLAGGDLKLLIAMTVFSGWSWTVGVFYYSLLSALPLFAFYMLKEKSWSPSVPYALAILLGLMWQHLDPLIKG